MADFSQQLPRGRGIYKQIVGRVYLNALVRVYKMQSGDNQFLYDFGIPVGTSGNTWEAVGYNYDWWRVINDRQLIVKRNKYHKGKVFYDDSLDEMLGGRIQTLG